MMTNHSGNGHPNPGDYWNKSDLDLRQARLDKLPLDDCLDLQALEKLATEKKSRGGRPSKSRLAKVHDSLKHKNAPCESCGQAFQSSLPAQRVCDSCRATAWSLWQQTYNRKRRRRRSLTQTS